MKLEGVNNAVNVPLGARRQQYLMNLKKINSQVYTTFEKILKTAMPSAIKIFQLQKTMLQEIPDTKEDIIRSKVIRYFHYKYEHRSAGQFFRHFEVRPYAWLLSQFDLTFKSSSVSETEIRSTANSIRFAINTLLTSDPELTSLDVLVLTTHKLVRPRHDQKATGIDFYDFSLRWHDVMFAKYGDKYDNFFNELFDDLDMTTSESESWIPLNMGTVENEYDLEPHLTQTDLDWMKEILVSFERRTETPEYPLARGPNNPTTRSFKKILRHLKRYGQSRRDASAGGNALAIGERPENIKLRMHVTQVCRMHLEAYGQYLKR